MKSGIVPFIMSLTAITLAAAFPGCKDDVPVSGISLEKSSITLTIFSSEQLAWDIQPANATNRNIIWASSNPDVADVSPKGVVTAKNFAGDGAARFSSPDTALSQPLQSANPIINAATGSAVITAATEDGKYKATITVTTTMEAQSSILDLPPLKDQFADYFLIGNIFRGTASEMSGTGSAAVFSDERLTRHYSVLTAENNMKPGYLVTGYDNGTYAWNENNRTTADNFVASCANSGIKVVGHTLLWHNQNASWMTGMATKSSETALAAMKGYIAEVAGRYQGKIHSWDVLNEIFPDSVQSSNNWKNVMRKENPWYAAIGSDFVYEGFLAARLADPEAILYYNDYNTNMPSKATMIRNMVRDVNNRYLAGSDKPAGEAPARLLIEGIGMQEHHNNDIKAASIKAAIDLFRPLGVILSVSELDILAYDTYSGLEAAGGHGPSQNHNAQSSNQQLLTQADLYGQFMELYLANADIIERVSLWGIIDSYSWRSRGLPLLFDHNGKAKPSYYRFTGALNSK